MNARTSTNACNNALINAHLKALDFFEKNVEYHEAVRPDKPLSAMPVFFANDTLQRIVPGFKGSGRQGRRKRKSVWNEFFRLVNVLANPLLLGSSSFHPCGFVKAGDFAVLRPLEEEAEIIADQIKEGTFVPKKFDTPQGMTKGFGPLPKSSTTMKAICMDTLPMAQFFYKNAPPEQKNAMFDALKLDHDCGISRFQQAAIEETRVF
ncbi:hypothetical protein HDU98_001070 [Podochytrium sp. JEL0797]|nr:hypothetical protein HDU98_001070 [Podochytrium sp. JEL0797]